MTAKYSLLNTVKVIFTSLIILHSSVALAQNNADEIGVYFLISADDENGLNASATDMQLQAGIAQLNLDFEVLNISFVLLDKVYLTNDDVAGINQVKWDTNNEEQVRPFIRYGALNIVVADLDGKNGHAYWNYEATDMIQVEPEDLSTSTTSHEFGHNLGLLHTYQSIDDGPISLLEGQDGWQYGDKVIDTAVDPGERSYYDDCIYSASAVDSVGDAYHPDGFNIMGKGQNTCRNRFSPEQLKRIKRILLSDKFHLLNTFNTEKNPSCSDLAIQTDESLSEGFNYNENPQKNSWRQDSYTDDFNWKFYNYTSTSSTGADAPYEGQTFLHIDASHELMSANDTINLISPCFIFEDNDSAVINFHYSMHGSDTGSLALQITTDNGVNWQDLWSKLGQQHQSGEDWSLATIALEPYMAAPFQLRFSAQVIGGSKGDISLDNVNVTTTKVPVSEEVVEEQDKQVEDLIFAEQLDVDLAVMVYSELITISGINTEIDLSINNGEYSLACQADLYTSDPIKVNDGESLCIRHISGTGYQEQIITLISLADQEFTFISTTKVEVEGTLDVTDSVEVTSPEVTTEPEQATTPEQENTAPITPVETIVTPETTTDPVETTDQEVTVAPAINERGADKEQEQKVSAGAIVWLLLGLVLRLWHNTKSERILAKLGSAEYYQLIVLFHNVPRLR